MNKDYRVITCDRCGKTQYFEFDKNTTLYSYGWHTLNDMELCPECSETFKNMVDGFIHKKQKRTVLILTTRDKMEALIVLKEALRHVQSHSYDGAVNEKFSAIDE